MPDREDIIATIGKVLHSEEDIQCILSDVVVTSLDYMRELDIHMLYDLSGYDMLTAMNHMGYVAIADDGSRYDIVSRGLYNENDSNTIDGNMMSMIYINKEHAILDHGTNEKYVLRNDDESYMESLGDYIIKRE